jgi:gliding motility-associated-like protein
MKHTSLTVIIFLSSFFYSVNTFANHVFGGELLYKYVSGNTYALTLTLYGDCGTANPTAFQDLYISTPEIFVYHGNYLDSFHVTLQPDSNIGIEVSPVCPSQLNNTTCNGGLLPGVRKFVYTGTATLNIPANNWHFLFSGVLGSNSGAGRSSNITNVIGANGTYVYIEATLNNLQGPNSSPEYTTIPTPFYTVNVPQQYNQGAVDPDGDSLSFQLVPALNNGNPVTYVSNPQLILSGAYPIVTDSGQFYFNPINGQMTFTPSIVQDALVVSQVTEYKNGIVVGTSKREMTFVVLDNLSTDFVQNTNAVNISGGNNSQDNVINLCVGSATVSFDINPVDTAGNAITVTHTPLPAGASLTIQNNNTTTPGIHFSWNTTSLPVGVYNFFVSYKNNACPLSTTQTIAYTINIVNPYELVSETQTATHCYYNADVTLIIKNGILPATVTVANATGFPHTVTTTTDTMTLSLPAGSYTGTISAEGIPACSAPFSFTVVDSGAYPFTPNISDVQDYCVTDSATAIIAYPDSNTTIQWFTANGDSLSSAPVPPTDSAGTYTWYVTEWSGACSSEKETVTVHVYDKPPIEILSEQGTVCIGETIYLEATGGQNYDWQPWDKILTDNEGKPYIRVFEPEEFTLYARSVNGCKDSIKLRYTNVEPCCQFSYPNAFTPNGDGKNDEFRALVIGNMKFYELSIYDRWGKRLFWNNNPNTGWDGTFRGRPCNADVYFYRVHAICYTGREEDVSGPLELLR